MAMDGLEPFIGEWETEAVGAEGSGIPHSEERGTCRFERMGEDGFVVQRWQAPDPFPDGLAVLGPDPEGSGYLQHYFDTRGVARVYKMTFSSGQWNLWRDVPDFSELPFRQRFNGTFSEDGNRIEGAWERTQEDGSWTKDFDLIYTRSG